MYLLGVSRVGKSFERDRLLVIDSVSALGGLASFLILGLAPLLIKFFIKPFNDLMIAKNFSQIRLIDGLVTEQEESMIKKFKDRFTFGFYFYYFWTYNNLSRCVLDCCFKRKKDRVKVQNQTVEEEELDYDDMANYYLRIQAMI